MSIFESKTILITGGTGSFGGYFVNYLLDKDFKEIRVFSRDELKQDEMRQKLQNTKITFHIGDIRDRSSVDDAMSGVDYVFHAAALKQVPSCEFFLKLYLVMFKLQLFVYSCSEADFRVFSIFFRPPTFHFLVPSSEFFFQKKNYTGISIPYWGAPNL